MSIEFNNAFERLIFSTFASIAALSTIILSVVMVRSLLFLSRAVIASLMLIYSAGNDSICKFNDANAASVVTIFCFNCTHVSWFLVEVFFAFFSSVRTSSISESKSRSSFFFKRTFVSTESSFASLNFWSKTSKSKNLAIISLRRVDPSSTNENAPCCEAREDTEKSSMVPKCLRIFASVWLRVVPFKEVVSPVVSS